MNCSRRSSLFVCWDRMLLSFMFTLDFYLFYLCIDLLMPLLLLFTSIYSDVLFLYVSCWIDSRYLMVTYSLHSREKLMGLETNLGSYDRLMRIQYLPFIEKLKQIELFGFYTERMGLFFSFKEPTNLRSFGFTSLYKSILHASS